MITPLICGLLAPNDPCPGYDTCACSEKTGWVPGPPILLDDHYVEIGGQRIDTRRELFSVKLRQSIPTQFPKVDFEFKLGTADPKDPSRFDQQTRHLTDELLKVFTHRYPCVPEAYTGQPVVYVTGHTDRLGEESYNLDLSRLRALRVAEGIQKWLQTHAHELKQPIPIEYVGLGEEESKQKGLADGQPNVSQRRVDVIAVTSGQPFTAGWQILGTVYPQTHPATVSNPRGCQVFS